jgi:hypothetical protein
MQPGGDGSLLDPVPDLLQNRLHLALDRSTTRGSLWLQRPCDPQQEPVCLSQVRYPSSRLLLGPSDKGSQTGQSRVPLFARH